MLSKLNNIYKQLIIEQYQNPYMEKTFLFTSNIDSNNKENQKPKKQYRSFQEFDNFCKRNNLTTKLEQLQQGNKQTPKYLIINLFFNRDQNRDPIPFEYFLKNNQRYYHEHRKIFKLIEQFLSKYIITKTGKNQYPICIIG